MPYVSKSLSKALLEKFYINADEAFVVAGYIPGGEVRSLGMEQGSPEPWYDKLGFTQVSFPQADYIFGTKRNDNKFVRQVSVRDLISEHEELKRQYRKIR